uniref:Uncharacterized protein n=1 Tax=Proboscia inermis TaxID=420281 RepID=A0A7S0GII3_9STRA|mmetsp:Transcript_46837/g.54750  ORF Transcript_46837/g.54750 Transcript_46837/m.54750 type:complete len:191 (+) Transcript_46837:76-648(+)|eukprot:CAMPEP_0171294250 /NCGR_PEP_ID=MMETSP0816-20121228/2675_1 /TAXON_ID=420281 /ORGANISM="Proboscia inermis, Strain CCAP1064/1" /LENGTH=190 /DNA_ID=CAMNT_0011765869 /DNA_START=48 /DNA_END=620 /DNA_ORIENTATION=+
MVRLQPSLALMLVGASSALQQPLPQSTQKSRRELLSFVGTGIVGVTFAVATPESAFAAQLKTGSSSVFTGDYEDPQHPGCLRQVKIVGAPLKGDGTRSPVPVVEVTGYDGKGDSGMCKDRPERSDLWKVTGKLLAQDKAVIDFSPKGGPSDLVGKWDAGGIVFPDGNKWIKIEGGTRDRRPKDMSTLKGD